MSDTAMVPRKPADGDRPAGRPLVDEQLADELLGKAAAEGVELLGPDGLLSQVTKAVLERALAEEMTGHLGYDNTIRPGGAAAITATAAQPRRC
jgi:putative transposase